jgi:hypothetical protein
MEVWLASARPEQAFVITALATALGHPLAASFQELPEPKARFMGPPQEVLTAYHQRLRMELLNVGMEQTIRAEDEAATIAILDQLLACEASSW